MREQVFVRTSNVVAAERAIQGLLNRPVHELVGLGLFYGDRGLGKSKLSFRLACQKGFLYFRIDASETAKSFSRKLLRGLKYRLHLTDLPEQIDDSGEDIPGSTNDLINKSIKIMHNMPNLVIILDEFDNAMHNRDLRETVRDLVDKTYAVVILVGMVSIREKLENRHPHYFDRCNAFVEFKGLTREDAAKICQQVADIPFTDKMTDLVYADCGGNYRKLIKGILLMEGKVKAKAEPVLTDADKASIQAE